MSWSQQHLIKVRSKLSLPSWSIYIKIPISSYTVVQLSLSELSDILFILSQKRFKISDIKTAPKLILFQDGKLKCLCDNKISIWGFKTSISDDIHRVHLNTRIYWAVRRFVHRVIKKYGTKNIFLVLLVLNYFRRSLTDFWQRAFESLGIYFTIKKI